MKLFRATLCRIFLRPVRSATVRVVVHARTPQAAGALLNRTYPGWERISWERLPDKPVVLNLPIP